MADAPVVHIGENSPEHVAYELMGRILNVEGKERNRKKMLDTYAECLMAVRDPYGRLAGNHVNVGVDNDPRDALDM